MKVRLLFFAVLRDIAGRNDTMLDLPDGSTAGDAWRELRRDYRALHDYVQPPLIAVNQNYVTAAQPLHEGDELVFIPPVAGG